MCVCVILRGVTSLYFKLMAKFGKYDLTRGHTGGAGFESMKGSWRRVEACHHVVESESLWSSGEEAASVAVRLRDMRCQKCGTFLSVQRNRPLAYKRSYVCCKWPADCPVNESQSCGFLGFDSSL